MAFEYIDINTYRDWQADGDHPVDAIEPLESDPVLARADLDRRSQFMVLMEVVRVVIEARDGKLAAASLAALLNSGPSRGKPREALALDCQIPLKVLEREIAETAEKLPLVSVEGADEAYRRILDNALRLILCSKDSKITAVGIGFALDAPVLAGKSMNSWGAVLKIKKQAISKISKRFSRQNGLPPSRSMKSEESAQNYRKKRVEQLAPAV